MLGWSRMTEAIRDRYGALGSRLHLAADGVWVAYAQWPDRAAWEQYQQMQAPVDSEAKKLMAEAIEERFTPILLEPRIDLLQPCHAEPPS